MKNQHKKGATRNGIYERRKILDSIKQLMEINPSKAKSELIRHLNDTPDDMYAWFYYGKLSQNESNLEEAEMAYTKVAESTSRNKYAGVVGLGHIARIRGDFKTAKEYYRRAITEHPKEGQGTFYMLAKLESIDGNYEEALRILDKVSPITNETTIEKARIYVQQGDLKAAQLLFDSIIPENELEGRTIAYERAKMAIEAGDKAAAQYYFLEARECRIKDSTYYKILSDEARYALETGNYQLAIDDCEEALADKEISYGENYTTLGIAKQSLQQYQSAITCYRLAQTEQGVSYLPKAAACYYLGCLELTMGDEEAAERDLKSSIISDLPPRPSVIDLLANIYIRQERYEEAKQLITDALQNNYEESDLTGMKYTLLIIKRKTGEISPSQRLLGKNYREKQAIDYKKAEAIIHIINHHQLGDFSEGKFPEAMDIEKLYDEIVPQLTDENRTTLDVMDRYFIDYPNAGYSSTGEICNRIGVVTLPGTKEILTMYPDVDNKVATKKDIMKSVGTQKSKTNDQISKFNARFANFIPPKK